MLYIKDQENYNDLWWEKEFEEKTIYSNYRLT
jgi:hypothetical protein